MVFLALEHVFDSLMHVCDNSVYIVFFLGRYIQESDKTHQNLHFKIYIFAPQMKKKFRLRRADPPPI